MAANLQSIQTLCHGCLSADRDLSLIGELSNMFTKICDRKTRVPGLKYTSLCWECTATLKRMQLFHKQVKNAQTILKTYIHTKDLQKSLPKTLSRLKATKTNHDFISLIESDEPELDIKLLDEIKEEEDHDEDKEFICEFEPYEPELDMKVIEHDKEEDFNEEDDAHYEENYFNPEEETHMEQEEEKDNEQEDDTDVSDAFNEEKDLKKDPNFIVEFKEKAQPQNDNRYCRISTAEEMCVKEQARPSDLVNLWGNEQGSSMSLKTVYRCLVCGHRSPSMGAAGRHVTQHKNIFKCRLCEFCCLRAGVARSHFTIAHKKFLCDYCGKKRTSKLLIQQHISRLHMENKCGQCSRTLPNYERLKQHIKLVHDEVDLSEETFCVRCNKQFKNKNRLEFHLRYSVIHADEFGKANELVKCLACDKMYTTKKSMMFHYKFVHQGIRNYYCNICDKSFCRLRAYDLHRRSKHEGVQKKRDKICSVCGRGFTDNNILKNHMRTHTGERPFACAVCDARFAQKVARDMHQKRHCRQNKAD